VRSVVTKNILLGTQLRSSATDFFSLAFQNDFMDVSVTVCLAGSLSWCTIRNTVNTVFTWERSVFFFFCGLTNSLSTGSSVY
jgi:hypothetical protein